MHSLKRTLFASVFLTCLLAQPAVAADDLSRAVKAQYDSHLGALFDHFHRNPELSSMEHNTAARLAAELREAGFEVRPDDIAVVSRTRPGRLTGLFHRLLPGAIFEVICRIWAVPTRRRELFAS